MNFIDKLGLILIQDGKVLMVKSANSDRLLLPGGKREKGESDIEALKREIREEISVELVDESIKLFGLFEGQAHGKPEGTLLRITAYEAQVLGELAPASEIQALEWVGLDEVEKVSQVGRDILKAIKTKSS